MSKFIVNIMTDNYDSMIKDMMVNSIEEVRQLYFIMERYNYQTHKTIVFEVFDIQSKSYINLSQSDNGMYISNSSLKYNYIVPEIRISNIKSSCTGLIDIYNLFEVNNKGDELLVHSESAYKILFEYMEKHPDFKLNYNYKTDLIYDKDDFIRGSISITDLNIFLTLTRTILYLFKYNLPENEINKIKLNKKLK